ncbi:hypothetical protein I312_105014 [Cryptococcus bacillisporus CA1280]|uniref:uncharacterized protein n=1 Tax=Cryptococcus bacillisporus CA1280 TaxID=1296109 RepID=UPI0033662924
MPTAPSIPPVPNSCASLVSPNDIAQQDIDDLLSGITAEDLDDFASTENENRREDGPGTAERTKAADLNSPLVKAEESFSGFSTATGKTIAPPSKAALEKAKRLWHQMREDDEIEVLAANSPAKHQRVNVSVEDKPTTPSAGFQTGQDAPVPSLSSAHSKKAPMIFQKGLTLCNPSVSSSSMISVIPEPQPGTSPTDFRIGFQTGRGATIAEPSSSARRKALNMFAEIESTADCLLDITSVPDNPQSGAPSSFLLASGKSAPTPNRSSVAKVMSLFADVESSSSPQPIRSRPLRSSAQHQLPASQPSTPLRKPLMATTNTYSSKAKSNAIKTPVTGPRRIGLGVKSTGQRSRPEFVTPFRTAAIQAKRSMTPNAIQTKPYNPVFDLTKLAGMGIPNDICAISPATARYYRFLSNENTHVGVDEALAAMRRCGCAFVTPEWTKNHWVQILWKLAGEVQAKPDLLTEKWSWEEVISQLKYREEADVFEAHKSCRLVLSGNSTSLARWHARLGMQSQPYVSGLSSLSVDGGIITLMDIVIERLFPIAFTNGDRNIRESPWDEEEEKRRQDKWKYAAETSPSGWQEESSDTMESEFEELLHAKDLLSRVRNFSSLQISHLAHYAQLRLSREMEECRIEVEAELETMCPPRDVRDFRMIRFKDGEEGRRGAFRRGMLSVWDARALGSTTLKEGNRYLVSNLIPGKSGDWRVGRGRPGMAEVYLHTRRDSRWIALQC